MSNYDHFNLYLGKYKDIPEDGHLRLPDAKLRVERATEKSDGLYLDNGKTIALILQDGNFWPMIAMLTPDEAEQIGRQLSLMGHAAKVGVKL
jgi:hypothetical protein